jgi:uncharacterized membrane protein YphA (DoxX/SURF4 family)
MSMVESLKYSNLFLRLSLAFVFIWFGVDKFINPTYWVNAWFPESAASLLAFFGLDKNGFMITTAVFEILVGVSILSSIFIKFFTFLAIIFLSLIFIFFGFNEVLVRDIGLIGGLLALLFWPSNRPIYG